VSRELAARAPEDHYRQDKLGQALALLGQLEQRERRFEEAHQRFEEYLASVRRAMALTPKQQALVYQQDLADALLRLGRSHREQLKRHEHLVGAKALLDLVPDGFSEELEELRAEVARTLGSLTS
jgi:hypothetical protein